MKGTIEGAYSIHPLVITKHLTSGEINFKNFPMTKAGIKEAKEYAESMKKLIHLGKQALEVNLTEGV